MASASIEGTAGDVMSKILFHTFELQSTTKTKSIKLDTVAPKEHERIVEVDKAPGKIGNLTNRFYTAQKSYREFDKSLSKKRKEAETKMHMFDSELYGHLSERCPDTLQTTHSYVDPRTGEACPYNIQMNVSTTTERIPKSKVREVFDEVFRSSVKDVYPTLDLEKEFNADTHMALLKKDTFVEHFHDKFLARYQEVQEEYKTFTTKFAITPIRGEHE